MSALYWCYRGDQAGPPFTIDITRAEGPPQACAAFGLAFPSPFVHELTSPGLTAFHEWLREGQVVDALVPRLPSAYDEFRIGRSFDFEAMETAGFNVD